jgi:outer membrane receptor protein involved in Fe transport
MVRNIYGRICFCIFLFSTLQAQNNKIGTIKGIVVNESTRRPIEFVNVVLQNKADSILITGTVTDKNGIFELVNIPIGEFIIKCRLLGYKEKKTASFKIDDQHKRPNLGTIALVETTISMDEVMVTSQKTLFNNAIDRKVYNVEQDIMSKAGSASELLQNIPSIEVDIDGNISLRGSSNVLIMINGKTSPLMGKSRAEVLQQMPAASIEKIEVITNPSAKYKPDGTSGIINIVLKKNTGLGTNGSVSANAGNDDRYNANIRLNYNPGDLNIFGSYSIRKDSRNRINSDTRVEKDSSTSNLSHYREDMFSYARPLSHMVALGGEYKINEANSTGLSGNYFYNSFDRNEISSVIQDSSSVMVNDYDRKRFDSEFEKEYGGMFFYQHNFSSEDHKLRLELNVSGQNEQEDNHYTNVFRIPSDINRYDNTLIKQDENKKSVSLDYSNPLTEKSTLEAGYEGEFNKYDFNFSADSLNITQQKWVKDVARTNQFILDENIHALYVTYEYTFGNFGLLGGLRAEESFIKSHLVTNDTTLNNDYFSIYPTVHLSYKLSEISELQINYSRRTRRPEADDLNPFPEYRDPKNISRGNPYLLPEYIHSVEFGYKFQTDQISLVPSIYYRYTYNRFTSVTTFIHDSISVTTEENLSNDQSAGVELILSGNIGDWFTANANVNTFYNQIDASNLGYSNNKSTITWSSGLTCNIHFTSTSMAQINSNYRSKRLTPQGENASSYVANLGFRQELMDGKLSLNATIADLFNTLKRESRIDTQYLNRTVINTRDSRIFYLGFTYHFGVPPKKSKEDNIRYDDGL